MNALGRWILLAAAGVLLALGLALGLSTVTYPGYPDDVECGSVLAPTSVIVSRTDDPLVPKAASCAAEIAKASPPVWSMLVGGVVLGVVALASLAGSPPGPPRRIGQDAPGS